MNRSASIVHTVIEARRPLIFFVEKKFYIIDVPLFNKEEKNQKLRKVNHVIEFQIVDGLPLKRGKVVYTAPCLGGPWPVDIDQAFLQAHAVCRKILKKGGKSDIRT